MGGDQLDHQTPGIKPGTEFPASQPKASSCGFDSPTVLHVLWFRCFATPRRGSAYSSEVLPYLERVLPTGFRVYHTQKGLCLQVLGLATPRRGSAYRFKVLPHLERLVLARLRFCHT